MLVIIDAFRMTAANVPYARTEVACAACLHADSRAEHGNYDRSWNNSILLQCHSLSSILTSDNCGGA